MRPTFSWPQQLGVLGASFAILLYGASHDVQARELPRIISSAYERKKPSPSPVPTSTPTPTPQRTPKFSPSPSPTAESSPTPTPEPTETPLPPVAIVTPSSTPTSTPEHVALNVEPAKNLINEAVQTIRDASPFATFKIDDIAHPYVYGDGKLDAPTTVKLYGLAGAITMLGIAFFNFKPGKQP